MFKSKAKKLLKQKFKKRPADKYSTFSNEGVSESKPSKSTTKKATEVVLRMAGSDQMTETQVISPTQTSQHKNCCSLISCFCCFKFKSYRLQFHRHCNEEEEEDVDKAFERYRLELAQKEVSFDDLSPSEKNTLKNLNRNQYWNWNDSVRSRSDRFLESLELDDISCGDASLRKRCQMISNRQSITQFAVHYGEFIKKETETFYST